MMASTAPRTITKSDPTKVTIEWDDGHTTTYSAQELRRLCPCAQCIDEHTGALILDRGAVPEELTQENLRLVGHYALSMRFSDGHETGIFPFPMLREHDPKPRSIPGPPAGPA